MAFKFDGFVYDGEINCEHCFEGDKHADDVTAITSIFHGESDTPDHCSTCGRPIHTTLTAEGFAYVMRKLVQYAFEPQIDRMELTERPDYYKGLGQHGILDDWAGLAEEHTDRYDRTARAVLDAYRALVKAEGALRLDSSQATGVLRAERRLRRIGNLWRKENPE